MFNAVPSDVARKVPPVLRATGEKDNGNSKDTLRFEENRTAGLLNVVVVLSIAAVAYTDWVVVANVSLGYLYLLPIALSALVNQMAMTAALAVVCTVLQDVFGPTPDSTHLRIVHASIGLTGFLIVGFLVTLIAKQRDRLAAEVRNQRDEYERDLVLASQVQQRVLPKPLFLPTLELAAAMRTARLLGGDYYDFFQIADDVVDVVIADVSGKGAAASLLMPSLAVALHLRARDLSGPAAVIKDLDEVLKQITNSSTFVTMFYGRINSSTRTLEYSSGGHNPPLLVRSRTGEAVLLEEGGPVIGILLDAQFSNTVLALEQGDILTLFTDGVTEQENENGEEFSIERLKAVMLRNELQPATALVAHIAEAVSIYAGGKEQTDDLTVVAVKVL
jgi:sigma-B regulation protein RsbU (phosphoserine phosphatase)